MKLLNKVLVGLTGVATGAIAVTAAVVITKNKVKADMEERFAEQNEVIKDITETLESSIKQHENSMESFERLLSTVEGMNKTNNNRFAANEKMTLFLLDVLKKHQLVRTAEEQNEDNGENETDYKSKEVRENKEKENFKQEAENREEEEPADTEEGESEDSNGADETAATLGYSYEDEDEEYEEGDTLFDVLKRKFSKKNK